MVLEGTECQSREVSSTKVCSGRSNKVLVHLSNFQPPSRSGRSDQVLVHLLPGNAQDDVQTLLDVTSEQDAVSPPEGHAMMRGTMNTLALRGS